MFGYSKLLSPHVESGRNSGQARQGQSVSAPRKTEFIPNLTERELFERLGWFISIRWGAGIGALLLVLLGWYRFGVRIPPRPVVMTIGALFLYNAFFLMLVTDAYRRKRVSRPFIIGCANAQIICDLTTLAVLMHFTGGVENYFMMFFICPMIVASELLSARNAYAHAVFGALLIHGVAWFEHAGLLPHVAVGEAIGSETYHNTLTVGKLTFALSCLLFAVVFLGSSIAERLRQRECELESAYRKLARLEESKSFFMRQTTHELRAPLNAVITMLQIIHSETADQGDLNLRHFIQRALLRTQSLSRLIEELHRFATLRSTKEALRAERVNLAEVVNHSINLFTPVAQKKHLRIIGSVQPATVLGDPEALTELAGNLIVNAIQYTHPGGEVSVRVTRLDQRVMLVVSDTGIGIPAEEVPKVFNELYRTTTAKQTFRDGTGMGLPIVKRIVETHSGHIEVNSVVGKGTTFTITLPLIENNPITASPVAPSAAVVEPPRPKENPASIAG